MEEAERWMGTCVGSRGLCLVSDVTSGGGEPSQRAERPFDKEPRVPPRVGGCGRAVAPGPAKGTRVAAGGSGLLSTGPGCWGSRVPRDGRGWTERVPVRGLGGQRRGSGEASAERSPGDPSAHAPSRSRCGRHPHCTPGPAGGGRSAVRQPRGFPADPDVPRPHLQGSRPGAVALAALHLPWVCLPRGRIPGAGLQAPACSASCSARGGETLHGQDFLPGTARGAPPRMAHHDLAFVLLLLSAPLLIAASREQTDGDAHWL